MKPTTLLFIALGVIFTLTPISEAVCANQAVYDQCRNIGNNQLSACAFDDWICKCNANKALQDCYLQCQDDPAIQTEAQANKATVEQSCSLAASQSSTKAQATPTGAPPAQPQAQTPTPTPAPAAPSPSQQSSPSGTTAKTNSAASDMIAVVPLIAAITVVNFIIGQFI